MLQCVACVAECWEKTESCQARFPGPLGQCKSCARRTEDSVHDVHDAHAVHESKSGMVPCVGDTSFRFAKHFLNFFIQIVILKHSMLAFPLVTLVHGMFFCQELTKSAGDRLLWLDLRTGPLCTHPPDCRYRKMGYRRYRLLWSHRAAQISRELLGSPRKTSGFWKRKSVESVLRVLYTFFFSSLRSCLCSSRRWNETPASFISRAASSSFPMKRRRKLCQFRRSGSTSSRFI